MEPTPASPEVPRSGWPLIGVGLVTTAVLLLWCAPSYVLYDTAELSWAGFALGVSHPPGQPTYSLLGKLATLLPFGSVAFRVGMVSAVATGLAVWLAGRLAGALALHAGLTTRRRLVEVLAAAAFACSGPLVNQATRPEVYAPAVAGFLATLSFVAAAVRTRDGPLGEALRPLAAAGLCASLTATLHPAAGLAALLVGLTAVAVGRPLLFGNARVWAAALGGLVVGLGPLAWIAVRCRPDVPCWEDSMTPARFWSYIRAAPYQTNFQSGQQALEAMQTALRFTLGALGWAPAVALLVALVAELVVRPAHPRRLGRSLLLALTVVGALVPLLFVAVAHFYPANPDAQGYVLPSIALFVVGGVVAAAMVGERLVVDRAAWGALLPIAVAAIAVGAGRPQRYARARYWFPLSLADRAFDEMLPRAFVLTTSDHLFFAMQYGQLVEGARPDVGVMVMGLAGNSHHWHQVGQRRPEIRLERAHRKVARYAHESWGKAALDLVDGAVPRYAETALLTPETARSSGVLFDVDGRLHASAPLPTSIARELRRRRPMYEDGSDRMLRLWRLERAYEREGHGEIDAAIREVLAGLWEEPETQRRYARVRLQTPLRYRPITPLIEQAWVAEPSTMRAMLAQLLYRGWRTDLAVRVLARDFRAGNPHAALVLAELLLYDGQLDRAEQTYRAFRDLHPEWADYANVGLALVRGARGDLPGATRELQRIGRQGEPPLVRGWATMAAGALLPVLGPNGVR